MLAARLVGTLLMTAFAVAIVAGLASGRPWLGGAVMMAVGIVALVTILHRR